MTTRIMPQSRVPLVPPMASSNFLAEARSRLKHTPPKQARIQNSNHTAAAPSLDMNMFLEELKRVRLRKVDATVRSSFRSPEVSTPAMSIAEASTPALSVDESSQSFEHGQPETPPAEEDVLRQAHSLAFAEMAVKAKAMQAKRVQEAKDDAPATAAGLGYWHARMDDSRDHATQHTATGLSSRIPSSPMPPVWVKPRPKAPARHMSTSTPRIGSPQIDHRSLTDIVDDDPLALSYSPPPQRILRNRPHARLSEELARAVQKSAGTDSLSRHTRSATAEARKGKDASTGRRRAGRKKAAMVEPEPAQEGAEYEPDLLATVGTRDPGDIGFVRSDGAEVPAPSFCTWGAGLY
ncbi:hypothetical protein CALVIDRAFT_310956 [Calocera viscosa TUFC12733]|uniref:Uncharacterized protein n=1 Tax=Calocera viscosa (strain TUFC12733) TaxID=1330018 RepID=A0A167I2Z8_CALVF|nr:hypothetical protein CALVIDRAFT_310956 [Calocera viscosa TUFC12733]